MKRILFTMLLTATTFAGAWAQENADEIRRGEDWEEIAGSGGAIEDKPDAMPTFPGGIDGWTKYLYRELSYPEKELRKRIEGRVLVQFVVTAEGKVRDVKVLQSVSPGLDAEAMRVVKKSRGWNPGIKDGKPVNTKFTIPIRFALNE